MTTGNPLICGHCGGQIVVATIAIKDPPNWQRPPGNTDPVVKMDGFVCEDCGRKPE